LQSAVYRIIGFVRLYETVIICICHVLVLDWKHCISGIIIKADLLITGRLKKYKRNTDDIQ